jgi:hypothetical protein
VNEQQHVAPSWIESFDMWTDEAYHADPFPQLEELRRTCPVAHSATHGGYWICTDYESVYRVLRDNDSFSHRQSTVPQPTDPLGPQIPVGLDPPAHGPWRALLTPAFSPAQVELFEPVVRDAAIRLLEPIRHRGECEFMADFAMELPAAAILPFLGLPASALGMVKAWEEESMSQVNVSPTARDRAYAETKPKVRAYLERQIAERIATGPIGDDVLSRLVGGEIEGRAPTMDEMVNACSMLLSAGLHTTTATLGNMVLYLAQHAEQRDRLTEEPSLIPTAIEELMRYEGLVTTGRVATKDVDVGGQVIQAGEPVLLSIPSALRDEAMFSEPDAAKFDREPSPTLAFGVGIHRCLGSHLARMELRVAMEEIHGHIPRYRLAPGRPVRRHTAIHRTTEALWLLVA